MNINGLLRLAVLAVLGLFLYGCQEGMSSDQIQQARLVGNENLQLKKQITDKDGRIADLVKQLEQSKQESKQEITLAQKQIQDKDSQIAGLTKESQQLRQELVKNNDASIQVQKSLDSALADCQQRLKNYEQTANAAPTPCPEVEKQYATLYENIMTLLSECQGKLEKYEPAATK